MGESSVFTRPKSVTGIRQVFTFRFKECHRHKICVHTSFSTVSRAEDRCSHLGFNLLLLPVELPVLLVQVLLFRFNPRHFLHVDQLSLVRRNAATTQPCTTHILRTAVKFLGQIRQCAYHHAGSVVRPSLTARKIMPKPNLTSILAQHTLAAHPLALCDRKARLHPHSYCQ
jgi:hypothetical protein